MTARSATGQQTQRLAMVRRLSTPDEARAALASAPVYAAYALAYLDPALFRLAEFYYAENAASSALVMHSRRGLGTSTVCLGDPELTGLLLRLHPGPPQTFMTCQPGQVDTLLRSHKLWRPQNMLRMRLARDAFSAAAGLHPTRRLVPADAAELNHLYATEGESLHYGGRQVAEGIYFGAFVRGRLVSAAGTHIHSAAEGVAVVGNVFTHPDYRGRGYGTAVTAAVSNQLLQDYDLIVLTVDPANRTARHIYEALGYRESQRLVEAMATRRDAIPLLAWLRRLLARRRSGVRGLEVTPL